MDAIHLALSIGIRFSRIPVLPSFRANTEFVAGQLGQND
jgi:hypothetical protein